MRGLVLAAALLLGSTVAAQPVPVDEPPKPFGRGSSMGGGFFGLSTGAGRTDLFVGASYGYFAIDGLGLGLSAELAWSNVVPTTFELAPFVRLVPFRRPARRRRAASSRAGDL